MKPWQTIEKAKAPDGTEMALCRREEEWVVRYDGKVLMSSRQHGSEDALAELALNRAAHRRAVLVGGLGLGFTVRAALDRMPVDGKVVVAELTPALVDWNRRLVGGLAGRPLDDARTHVHVGDAVRRIQEAHGAYDAILLDIDNGPASMVHDANHRLYGPRGIAACKEALREGGVLAVWSAHHDDRYLERLERGGLAAEMKVVPARGALGGQRHVIFLGVKRSRRAARASPAAEAAPFQPGPPWRRDRKPRQGGAAVPRRIARRRPPR